MKRKTIKKQVLELIKVWNGHKYDSRFPEGYVKELVREIKKLKEVPVSEESRTK